MNPQMKVVILKWIKSSGNSNIPNPKPMLNIGTKNRALILASKRVCLNSNFAIKVIKT